MAIGLTHDRLSILSIKKKKSFTNGSILLTVNMTIVSIVTIGIDPLPIMPSYDVHVHAAFAS
jgi:uncharacterized membrane-anchored protein YitT (DUF2179 family)